MPKQPAPKIKYVTWRNGRPRFEPSPTLRAAGHQGTDLRHEDGRWFSAGEALEWSRALEADLQAARNQAREKARKTRQKAQEKAKQAAPRPVGRPKVEPLVLPPSLPLSRLFDEWLHGEANPGMKKLSGKTVYDYRLKARVLEKHFPQVWHQEAGAFTRPACVAMYDQLVGKVGNAQAVATMRVLGICFAWAIRRGRIEGMLVNPAHELGMSAPPPRIRVGSKEEIEHLVAVADLIGRPELGDMILLGVFTGQRQGDRRMLTVTSRQNGRILFRQMKTKARVSIPEIPALKARLAAAERRRKEAGIINPHVVLDERRWVPFTQTHYAHLFAELRQIAGQGAPASETMPQIRAMPSLIGKPSGEPGAVDEEENPLALRDQDLRDTAVTWLARAGCTIPEICAITGHSLKSATTIFRHYLAIDPAMADSAMAKMVAWYDEEGEGK